VPDPTYYIFDGNNLMHAGELSSREELVDKLAGFVATRGVRGVVVFDGVGDERGIGRLSVRYAAHADDLIERLAAERRTGERVAVVSSDRAIEHATGKMVTHAPAADFIAGLIAVAPPAPDPQSRLKVEDSLDADVREQLERMRRER